MAKKVEIKIGGDTSVAKASIKDLQTVTEKSLKSMSATAEKESAEISAAYKKSGIRTEESIKKSSADAKRNFEKIKNSGVASANDIRRAHNVMTAKIKRNNQEMAAGASKVSKVMGLLKGKLVGLAVGIGVVTLFKEMTATALGNEIQVRKLKTQIDNLNGSYDENEKRIWKVIEASAKYATVQTGDVSEALQNLVFVSGDVEKSLASLNLIFDLAHLKSISVKESTDLIGKAMSGNVTALGRYFVEFKGLTETLGKGATNSQKAAFAVAFLNEKVAGSIDNMTRHEFAVRFVKNEWSSFIQLMGEKIFVGLDFLFRQILGISIALKQMQRVLNLVFGSISVVTDKLGITNGVSEQLAERFNDLNGELADLKEKLAKANGETEDLSNANDRLTESSKEVAEAIKAKNAELNKDTSTTHTVNTVFTTSGQPGFVGPPEPSSLTPAQQAALGAGGGLSAEQAALLGFKDGGGLPGYGGGDRIPAMLEAGEHIIKKESVKKIGRAAAEAFNRGDIAALLANLPVRKYADGGEVSPSSSVRVDHMVGGKSFPMTASKNVASGFVKEIKGLNIRHGRRKVVF